MSLNDLPLNDLISPLLPIRDLLRLAQTNSYYRRITSQDSFWERRLRQDFPEADLSQRQPGESIKDYYLYLAEEWEVPVTLYTDFQEMATISVRTLLPQLRQLRDKYAKEERLDDDFRLRILCLDEGIQPILLMDSEEIYNYGLPLKSIGRIFLFHHRGDPIKAVEERRHIFFVDGILLVDYKGKMAWVKEGFFNQFDEASLELLKRLFDEIRLTALLDVYPLRQKNLKLPRTKQELIDIIVKYALDRHRIFVVPDVKAEAKEDWHGEIESLAMMISRMNGNSVREMIRNMQRK